jgi:uncharacterized membrane protein YcjF (UPF0283 family)
MSKLHFFPISDKGIAILVGVAVVVMTVGNVISYQQHHDIASFVGCLITALVAASAAMYLWVTGA